MLKPHKPVARVTPRPLHQTTPQAMHSVKKDFVATKVAWATGQASENDAEAGRGGSAWAEFEAEQEMMKTMSYLSADEQQKYAKPPGLDAVMEKEKQEKTKLALAITDPKAAVDEKAAAEKAAREEEELRMRAMELEKVRADPYKDMLKAKMALATNERFDIKQCDGSTYGGYNAKSDNQQLLDDDEDDEGDPQAPPSSDGLVLQPDEAALLGALSEKDRAKLREAEAILVAAGYNLKDCRDASQSDERAKKKHKSKHGDKDRKHHKEKDKKKDKRSR
eukprot:gene4456-14608_t